MIKIDFPTDTDHSSLQNSAEKEKQKINEEEIFLKTGLKKKWERYRDVRIFNWWDKTWLIKNFYQTRQDVVVDNIINVNDWRNITKNKVDFDI